MAAEWMCTHADEFKCKSIDVLLNHGSFSAEVFSSNTKSSALSSGSVKLSGTGRAVGWSGGAWWFSLLFIVLRFSFLFFGHVFYCYF